MLVNVSFGNTAKQLHHFNPRAMLGREDNGCELWVADPSVSRRHAEVFMAGEKVYLRDLGSTNGTWVNGQPVGAAPVELAPGNTVHLGHSSLVVEWSGQGPDARTTGNPVTPELAALMAHRAQQLMAGPASAPQYAFTPTPVPAQPVQQTPPAAAAAPAQSQPIASSPAAFQQAQQASQAGTGVAATVGVGGTVGPSAAAYSYRRQGGNNNGTLLIALPGDTFANETTLDGFLEFTATDKETVASIIIELVEFHKKGPKTGHVWDRCLVRQGPWKTKKGDVLAMPFQLRVPSGTSVSSPTCHWQLRAYVDIEWALDIEASSPINMRNTDIEKIRDALGSLDYRLANLEAEPLGQTYTGKFQPPLHLCKQLNITDVNLDIEYLGVNMKVRMEVEKNKLFHFDKKQEFVFELARLRAASVQDLASHWQTEIAKLMQ